jgi:hypothetical protein
LKNDVEQIPALLDDLEFTVNEECVAHGECAGPRPFITGGKAAFRAEYDREPSDCCPQTQELGLSSIRKDRALGTRRRTC